MIRLQNVPLPLSYGPEDLSPAAAGKLRISVKRILSCTLVRRAVDAGTRGRYGSSPPWT